MGCGSGIVPFADRFPKDTQLYRSDGDHAVGLGNPGFSKRRLYGIMASQNLEFVGACVFMSQKNSSLYIVQGAMIAAAYVVLTIVFAPISFQEIQIRVSEALTILPVFTPAAVPGLAIGCLLANIIGGAALPDVIFGSLATLIGAVGTRLLRNRTPVLAIIPPIVANMLIVPFVLRYAYGVKLPILLMMGTVALGEVISCGVLGLLLHKALLMHRKEILKSKPER